jgi:hypothetical protein
MIGGRRTRKNVVGEKYSTFFNSDDGSSLIANPIVPPRKTTAEGNKNQLNEQKNIKVLPYIIFG